MLSPQSLRRPSNWQDFETLCKKLWGEIWQCPEIKKNGRTGQAQHGVDVYGKPTGEHSYFGIQCKGKDEYTDKQFSQEEIIKEVEKAKLFEPPLKKLYFASTAVKDTKIEAFVRKVNLEQEAKGLFEVHLFCWEDIVDLIDENKATADWYIKNQNYKSNHQAELTFLYGDTEILLKPKFKQTRTVYRMPPPKIDLGLGFTDFNRLYRSVEPFHSSLAMGSVVTNDYYRVKVNLNYVPIRLALKNTGTETLENYKVYITVEGDILDTTKDNKTGGLMRLIIPKNYVPTTRISENDQLTLTPRDHALVPNDRFVPEVFYIKPNSDCTALKLHYKLLSRYYQQEGSLMINLEADIDYKSKYIEVMTEEEERTEYGELEDYFEYEDDK